MTVEDDLDDLYDVAPGKFLARRKELVVAAKKRGDVDAAKSIGAARKPTMAAWVVNALMRAQGNAKGRLIDHGERLRAAHAAMDGVKIRELSAAQRNLIDGLVRAGFSAGGVLRPSAALRDDVVGTLQAAIADPDVAARLGRLEKAERWAGFGEFGTVTAVGADPKPTKQPEPPDQSVEAKDAELATATERRSRASSDADAARVAHSDALGVASEQKAKLAKARRRYEELLQLVDAAEQALNAADEQFEAAQLALGETAEDVDAATSKVDLAEAELVRITTTKPAP